MTITEFIEILDKRGIAYEMTDSGVTVTHNGDVSLREAHEIPPGVSFANHGTTYLESVIYLSGGVVFENSGDVALHCLTALKSGAVFKNDGNVWAFQLDTLGKGVTFENGGDVFMGKLSTLHGGVSFNNAGRVTLPLVTGMQVYQWTPCRFMYVNGTTFIITKSTSHHEAIVHEARRFGGGPIESLKRAYIVEENGLTTHGATLMEAFIDLALMQVDHDDTAYAARELCAALKGTMR